MMIRLALCCLALVAFYRPAPAFALEALVKLTAEQAQHVGILTRKPQPTSHVPLVRAAARITLPPKNEYMVGAAQAGLIAKVEVALGGRVSRGQVLADIQSPGLLGLERALLDALTSYNLAQAKLQRDRVLLEEGIISRIRWQETQSDFDRYSNALREAQQVLAVAGVDESDIRALQQNRRLSSVLHVRSPIDGIVLERLAVPGQRVDLLAPLFRVGKLEELWLEIDVPQERLPELRVGDYAFIDNTQVSARITEISGSVNANSQTGLARAVIEGKPEQLRPGQHVNAQLMHDSSESLLRVPASALLSQQGKNYLFVRTAEGFAIREADIASQDEHELVLHPGAVGAADEVVIQGVAALKAAWLGIGEGE